MRVPDRPANWTASAATSGRLLAAAGLACHEHAALAGSGRDGDLDGLRRRGHRTPVTPTSVTSGWAMRHRSMSTTSCERWRRRPATPFPSMAKVTTVRQPEAALVTVDGLNLDLPVDPGDAG